MPFSSLYFVIGHLEKSFPESIMVKALIWDKVNKIRKVYVVQYRTVFSIQAETERYDIVHFARVTTMSLVSGTGF